MKKEDFLKDVPNFGNHRFLLWQALEATKGAVLELGCGDHSTPFLRQYCQDANRAFSTYDSDKAWAQKHDSIWTANWDIVAWLQDWDVVLVDEAPGEHRKISIQKLKAKIIVIHDSEPIGWNSSYYQVRPLFKNFKYVKDHIPEEKGAPWTTALSNEIDVTKWSV